MAKKVARKKPKKLRKTKKKKPKSRKSSKREPHVFMKTQFSKSPFKSIFNGIKPI